MKRIEIGLPLTHWQQFRLHLQSAWRQRRKPSPHRVAFHMGGVLRALWRPFTLFALAGVPVQFHLTCVIYPLGLVTLLNWRIHPTQAGMLVLAIVLLVGFSLLVHEFAHVLTARRMGIGTRRVVFIPIGAFAELETLPPGRCEFAIAAAGPLASLALAGCFWLAQTSLESVDARWTFLPRTFCTIGTAENLILAFFNLLPCFPMDGGRILRSLLTMIIGHRWHLSRVRAQLTATRITVRYVTWLVALGMMTLTILVTHGWLHLLLFPLLLVAAEGEYWLLRTEESPSADDSKAVRAPRPENPFARR